LRILLLTRTRVAEVMQAIDAYEAHVCEFESGVWQDKPGSWKLEQTLIEGGIPMPTYSASEL